MSFPPIPSMAISFRINHRTESQFRQNDRHDLRKGPQPKYVDSTRSARNTVIVPYLSVAETKAICVERRSIRDTKRATKSNAAIASTFLISFGKGLQPHVSALSDEDQDRLYSAVSHAIGLRLEQKVSGLCAHRDETAPHGHGFFPALRSDGFPLAKYITPTIASELQQIAEDTARPFLPMIQRRKTKEERKNDSEPASAIYHRSVRQLHDDLPREISALEDRLTLLNGAAELAQARVDEMQLRVSALDAKADLTEKEIKRKGVYEKRLADRLVELQAAQSASEAARIEADRLADLARADRDEEQRNARRIIKRVAVVQEAVEALVQEVSDGTIARTTDGKVRAAAPDLLRRAYPEIRPAVSAAADLGKAIEETRKGLDERSAELDRKETQLQERETFLSRQLAIVARLRDDLTQAVQSVRAWLSGRSLTPDERREGVGIILQHREALLPPEEPEETEGPGF